MEVSFRFQQAGNTSDYRVIGNYPDAMNAATIIRRDKLNIVIMDINMPGKNGITAVAEIKEARPHTLIIMYTMFEDDESLFHSLCAGANGYIIKKTSPFKLFEAIGDVLEGGPPMSPAIAKRVLQSFAIKANGQQYHLTPREKEVLQLLSKGYSIKEIAQELVISFDTGARTSKTSTVNSTLTAVKKPLRRF